MRRVKRLAPSWAVALAVALATPMLAAVTYTDEMADVGMTFQQAGEISDPEAFEPYITAFPEIIGGGACMIDLDGDGLDDVYWVSQQFNPENDLTQGWIDHVHPHGKLYVNDGDGTFTDRTDAAGVESGAWGYGCSAADYDGDGSLDLFLANYGPNELFRNNGDGTFTNVTAEAGVGMSGACGDHRCMSTNSAWADYDRDGDLDLYVGNYVDTALDDPGLGPGGHLAQFNFLHRNNGDGTFTEVAHDAGVEGDRADVDGGKSFGVMWFDHDLDGWMDLYVANDMSPNDFYVNQGDGTFVERSAEAGVDDADASMGLAVADYDGDGYPDLYFTHYTAQEHGFYRNSQDGTFEDRSGEDGLVNDEGHVGWGAGFVDYDRDGDLDIIQVNGHTAVFANNYDQTAKVIRNDPEDAPATPWDRRWVDVSAAMGAGITDAFVGRGSAYGDYDLDGDTDVAINDNGNQTARFLRAAGLENHWLNVRLAQDGPNRFGVGAKVKLEVDGLAPQFREVQAGSSYLSQSTLTLEFGLRDRTAAERITVTWPDGGTTIAEDIAADQTVRIDRANGAVVTDVVSPLTTATVAGTAGVDGWYGSTAQVALDAADRGSPTVSGLAGTEVAIDGAPFQAYGEPVVLSDEGAYRVTFRSADVAGNVEPVRPLFVGIDRTPPTADHALAGTAGERGWWVEEPVTVSLVGADGGSGVHEILVRVDGGAWAPYDGPFEIADDGEHALEFFAVDRAGNEGRVASVEILVDRTSPDLALKDPGAGSVIVAGAEVARLPAGPAIVLGAAGDHLVVCAEALDATSGVDRVVFLLGDEVRAVDREGPEWTWDWVLDDEETGLHELHVAVIDRAGNVRLASHGVVVVAAPAA